MGAHGLQNELASLRVALVHHWLVKMRGAERVLELFCDLFPTAEIHTLVAAPEVLSDKLRSRRIHTSFVQHLPRAREWYRYYLPLFPGAFEQLDPGECDLVLTSDASLAKTILPPCGAVHVCYCHSPPRYLWNMYHQYLRDACRGAIGRLAFRAFSHRLRIADYCAAGRVDHFLCNSRTVRRRVARYYGRPARVIHPPADLDRFSLSTERGDYYLVVSQLSAYKRVDLAVQAFNRLDRRLVVVGEGPERRRLARLAGPNVELRGFVPDRELPSWYAGCRAFVFAGEEDFGITPLEAQASGKPVIAYGAGGATETVVEGETGLFFEEPSAAALAEAVERFEQQEEQFDPEQIRSHAELFSPERFKDECGRFILRAMEEGEPR